MKSILIAIAMVISLLSTGCVTPVITPDKCILFDYVDDQGNDYQAGICEDERYIVQWENSDGYKLRAEFLHHHDDEYRLMYYSPDGDMWIAWSSKSGISIDGMPENIQDATRA